MRYTNLLLTLTIDIEEIMTIRSAVLIQCQRVTDRQTDGQTDVQPISITCFSIADARKNASNGCRKWSAITSTLVTYRPISTSSYPPSRRHIDGNLDPSLMILLTAGLLMTYPAPPDVYPCGMFVKKWWPTYSGLLLLNWARNLSRFSQITYLKSAVHVSLIGLHHPEILQRTNEIKSNQICLTTQIKANIK